VDCSSEITVRAGFKSIANLCGWSVNDTDPLSGIKDQLASLDECTLLVLDNCDDPITNFSDYIPDSPRVGVMLTTRLNDAENYASPDPRDVSTNHFLRLDGLELESAVGLILQASGHQEHNSESEQQAQHIANAVDRHPHALVVASSLIQSTTYSLETYATALSTRSTQNEVSETGSEQATYRKVSATFEVSAGTLEDLARIDPSAQHALALLDILGFFHHQDISEDIFVRAWEWAEEVSSRSGDGDWSTKYLTPWHVARSQHLPISGTTEERKRAFRRCRAHLVKMSLVITNAAGYGISLHPLVHTWARERVHNPLEVRTAAASTLSLSTMNLFEWEMFTPSLVKHLEACLAFRPGSCATIPSSLEICRIWHAFTWQMESAHSPAAMKLCETMVADLSGLEDGEDLLVSSQHLLGILYLENGQTRQATELLEHVVTLRSKLAGDHISRLVSQHELARAYKANGQIPRAIEILEHVVKVQQKLADDNPRRLDTQHQLAAAYWENGQGTEARRLFEQVVAIQQESLHADHPDRVCSERWLARILRHDMRASEPSPDVSAGAEQFPEDSSVPKDLSVPEDSSIAEDPSPLSTRDNVAIPQKRDILGNIRKWRVSLLKKRSRVPDGP
jgi:hypothetical protein